FTAHHGNRRNLHSFPTRRSSDLPRPVSNLKPAFSQFKIGWMTGVDTLYAGLLAEPWFTEKPLHLKYVVSGGTALRSSTATQWQRSEEHTSELQSRENSVCRLLLE